MGQLIVIYDHKLLVNVESFNMLYHRSASHKNDTSTVLMYRRAQRNATNALVPPFLPRW